ncbi:ATP-binding protein [bacterium]|jgi:nicotinamide riboside kinase|nr:ATP-binding protein [bacterium]
MIVVNFWGGPNSGKSTQASGLFHKMKTNGYSVEVVNEYAKMCVWEDQLDKLKDQLYITAKQNRRVIRLQNKVDICITDSPLMLGAVYRNAYDQTFYSETIDKLCYEIYSKHDNINFFMKRTTDNYAEGQRSLNYENALKIDERMYQIMKEYSIPFYHLDADEDSIDNAYKYVQRRIEKDSFC